MSLAIVHSRACVGVQAPRVTVEVHAAAGLPCFQLVGLPEASVRESRERVRSALINAGFEFPAKRITVNLAPADLPKEGGRFDLPIALGILAASGQLPEGCLEPYEFAGELSLEGKLRDVQGAIPFAYACAQAGTTPVLPGQSAAQAALQRQHRVLAANHLLEVTAMLVGQQPLTVAQATVAESDRIVAPCLSEVRGQALAKRALTIAAAGAHHLLFFGPPGTGKTMLASRLAGILPEMSDAEALETAAVYSVSSQGFTAERYRQRPFRSPHHSSSAVALVGGGAQVRPGEISLAHNGILFLDELTEFDRKVLEMLREPLEAGRVTISRAARQADYPAQFQLVAAMNPSPCGHWGDPDAESRSTPEQVRRYLSKLSGPFLDRFDLTIEVPKLPKGTLSASVQEESSATVRARVVAARQRAYQRQRGANAQLSGKQLAQHCQLEPACQHFLEQAVEKLKLSARAYHRILRVARTIADLADCASISNAHIAEAIGYRAFDRFMQQL